MNKYKVWYTTDYGIFTTTVEAVDAKDAAHQVAEDFIDNWENALVGITKVEQE